MIETGVCIQAGLYSTAEYLYLSEENWNEHIPARSPNWNPHPKIVESIESWDYYGIEHDPHMLIRLIEEIGKNSGNWINTSLSGKTHERRYRLMTGGDHQIISPIYVPFQTLDELLFGLGLNRVDILALDIENDEFLVLRDYSWRILPQMIACEVHSFLDYSRLDVGEDLHVYTASDQSENPSETLERNCDMMENLLKSQGYKLYFKESVNTYRPDEKHFTKEMKFIHSGPISTE